jgi:NAD(P)H-flavin reductase
MMCGPETMMVAGAKALLARGVTEDDIYLSMERNMQCGVGLCGHCQHGANYVCRDGPVFAYPQLKELLYAKGF